MTDQADAPLPGGLVTLREEFLAVDERDRLQLLLEVSEELPDLPERLAQHPELLEPVPECQSPIFLVVEVEGTGPGAPVHLFFSAPPEAPTTRGFAAILHEGLDGLTAGEVLAVPADITEGFGLAGVVSPLRLRGMAGMLARVQRQVREKSQISG